MNQLNSQGSFTSRDRERELRERERERGVTPAHHMHAD